MLTLRTMSKAYGLAGIRVGYAVGDPHVITALRKVAIPFALSSVAQAAGLAALAVKDELAPRWQQVIAERERVTGELRDFGFEVPTSQANFVWLPLRERAAEFAAHCEATNKVIVRAFPDAAGGVRVTIGSPDENDAFLPPPPPSPSDFPSRCPPPSRVINGSGPSASPHNVKWPLPLISPRR